MSEIKVFMSVCSTSLHNWSFRGLYIRTDNEYESICLLFCETHTAQLTSFANENVQFGQQLDSLCAVEIC